jgi:hypothetical protein
MGIVNLHQQVIHLLVENGKSSLDVLWVGVKELEGRAVEMSWEEFQRHAANQWAFYPIYPMGLVIVGDRWWIEVQYGESGDYLVLRKVPERPRYHGMTQDEYTLDHEKEEILNRAIGTVEGNLAEALLEERESHEF